MLVLSRKEEEKIVITLGDVTVRVQVVAIQGNKVRLGVAAPKEVAVDREEIWRRRAEFEVPGDRPLILQARR